MSLSSSTLVETININAEDFTDNFLTCPTCMSAYDEAEHTPKLLSCSHTLCRQCLERIASTTAIQIPSTSNNESQTGSQTVGASQNGNPGLLTINNSLSRSIAAADAALAVINNNDSSPLLNINSSRLSNSSIISSASNRASNGSNSQATQPIIDLAIRCPICRETIILPRNGGIVNLPPSFIINQLLDLVKTRRSRDVIPRCVNHINEELLYCETCDKSFCSICESHFTVATNADHIIIPFSIALKRITEIYLFKSSQCLNSFSLALANVQHEVVNLNQTVESVAEKVERSFDELKRLVDERKNRVLGDLRAIQQSKCQLLTDQVKLIMNEKQKVEAELKQYEDTNGHYSQNQNQLITNGHSPGANSNLSYSSNGHSESKSLGAKIQSINEKLDCLRTLCEPRENSFINYQFTATTNNDTVAAFQGVLGAFGRFRTSNTYPPLCTARIIDEDSENYNGTNGVVTNNGNGISANSNGTIRGTLKSNGWSSMAGQMNGANGSASCGTYSVNLSIRMHIQTVDNYGNKRTEGGDPVSVIVTEPSGRQMLFKSVDNDQVVDLGNGVYTFKFVPNQSGKYRVDVSVFGRAINQMPIWLNIIENNESLWTFGGGSSSNSGSSSLPGHNGHNGSSHTSLIRSFSLNNKGSGDREFNMPISVRCLAYQSSKQLGPPRQIVFILDSGNNRIKVLTRNGQFLGHLRHVGLSESSATALAIRSTSPSSFTLVSLNWRLKCITSQRIDSLEEALATQPNQQPVLSNSITRHDIDLEEPIQLMETFHPDLYIVQDNKKKIYLCTESGVVLCSNLEAKLKQELGIKNLSAFCGHTRQMRLFVAESAAATSGSLHQPTLYECDLDWLCDYKLNDHIKKFNLTPLSIAKSEFTHRKYSYPTTSPKQLSGSLTSLLSTSSAASTSTTQSTSTMINGSIKSTSGSAHSSYTALWHDHTTNKLLAARADKHRTYIEVFDSQSSLYEYSIESGGDERPLKKVTSVCSTSDGRIVSVDLVQNCAKMFRFV